MTDTQGHKPAGFTREMREARAAQQAQAAAGLSDTPPAVAAPPSADGEIARTITRENRRPFGATTQKLAYPPRPGYYRHWFNDEPGRILGAEEAGYAHVKHDRGPKNGQNVEAVVGRRESGHPQMAYLMEIPQEWRDDDTAAYEAKNASIEAAIKKGSVAVDKADPKDVAKFYPSAQGRQISLTRGSR
jgi:hypothetical protein